MKEIRQFDLADGVNEFYAPANSLCLHVGIHENKVNVWALVDRDEEMIRRRFHVLRGWDIIPPAIDEDTVRGVFAKHLGSAQENGSIWHVFEEVS